MATTYVQHEYSVSQPWSLNSNHTDLSSGLDGDEELLVLDNSRLGFDDDFCDEDFCRCYNCTNDNQSQHMSGNGIAVISDGNIMEQLNSQTSGTPLDPSDSPYLPLSQRRDSGDHHHHNHSHSVDANDHHHRHSMDANGHNHSHKGHTRDHNWLTHCHPNPSNNSRSQSVSKATRQLLIGSVLCAVFMLAEFIGGFFANSLAIMTDAAHLMSDLASFGLSLFAIWMSQKRPTKKMSFGYHRAEVLGAVASIFMIWVLTGVLVYLAIDRIRNTDYDIDSTVMIVVSGAGVAMNIVMGLTLSDICCGKKADADSEGHDSHTHSHSHSHSHASHGHSHTNMNVRAALIHVIGDLIQSIGVLIAALIIKFKPEYKMADPICTFIFSILVMFTTYGIMRDAIHVLMEGFPTYLDYSAVKKDLLDIDSVESAHSLHIWSLTMSRNALAVHLAINSQSDPERILKMAEKMVRKKYDIQDTTIQVERFDSRTMNDCITCKGP